MKYLFYRLDSIINSKIQEKKPLPDKRFNAMLWKPTSLEIIPKGIPWLPFGVWWIMHHLHIFTNRDYSLYLIYIGYNLIHRSVITPRYFRFPFMDKDDLQIGDTWTATTYSGKGLATFAIQMVCQLHMKPSRRFWYLVEETNLPSIRAVEKVGFTKVGEGNRIKRFGLSILGAYNIQKYYVDESQTI